jgi:tetratricopeptide (TPR) repeat protein
MSIAGLSLPTGMFRGCRSVALGAILCSLLSGEPVLAFQAKPEAPPVLDAKSQKIEDLVTAAKSKMESRNWDAAMLDCTAALQVDEKSARALVARGMVYNGKGEYDNAIKDFDVVTELKGREPDKLRDRADSAGQLSGSHRQRVFCDAGKE